MNHNQALTLFWGLVTIMLLSWTLTIWLVETDSLNQSIARVLTITDLFFIPVIIMIPLIGSNYFKNKLKEQKGNVK